MGPIQTVSILVFAALLATSAGLSCRGVDSDDTAASAASLTTVTSTASPGASVQSGTVKLPPPRTKGQMSLEEAIQARRSIREFTDQPLGLDEVGQLLWAAQGITSSQGGRAAPSAGGTYPLELYLVAGQVTGLEPGVYRYRPMDHELVPVTSGDVRGRLAEASLDQSWVGEAAADVIIAAVYARTTERYGERGVRYVHLEAGHAAENLCLQATALGLGAVTVGAFSDEEVSRVLHLPVEEAPFYVIPIGRPTAP